MTYLTTKKESVTWQLAQFFYPKKLIRAEISKRKKEEIEQDEFRTSPVSRFLFVTTSFSSSQRPRLSNSRIIEICPSGGEAGTLSKILSEFEEAPPISDFELIDPILEKSWLPMHILKSEIEQEERIIDESLNYYIVMKYKKFEFVNSIFFQKYKKELRYYVYFKSEQYDSNIMNQLISTELNILDSYPNLHFDFIYCPSKIEKKTHSLGKYKQKIYERK